jgi:hypothetical protein
MLATTFRRTGHAAPRAPRALEQQARSAGLLLLLGAGANNIGSARPASFDDSERLMITPDEALRILEAQERAMAVGGRGGARQCAQPPRLDEACVARERDRVKREVASPLHNSRPGDIADEPGSPVDGAGAARDDDGAAATATRSAAAGSRQASPQAPAAFLRDGSTGGALRDDGDGSDVHVIERQAALGRRAWGHGDALFEPGDEILVERRLRWARQMPLAERRARRYSKPQSCVG